MFPINHQLILSQFFNVRYTVNRLTLLHGRFAITETWNEMKKAQGRGGMNLSLNVTESVEM